MNAVQRSGGDDSRRGVGISVGIVGCIPSRRCPTRGSDDIIIMTGGMVAVVFLYPLGVCSRFEIFRGRLESIAQGGIKNGIPPPASPGGCCLLALDTSEPGTPTTRSYRIAGRRCHNNIIIIVLHRSFLQRGDEV